MGKLVSNVTTCLVVLSSRFYFWKKQAEMTEPTTERHGHDGPSRVSRFKTLRKTENWVLKIDSLRVKIPTSRVVKQRLY